MNESGYTRAVNKQLPACVYHWKIADRFTNGIPDAWYSSQGGDIWVEYKYYQSLPKRLVKPKLSPLQKKWLADRYSENRQVAVIIGSPEGAIVLTDRQEWESGVKRPDCLLSKKDVAAWIAEQCGVNHAIATH